MKPSEFVDTIRRIVLEASVADTITAVSSPPGRQPPREFIELATWFNGLSERDGRMVRRMLVTVARHSVFGLLAVLDGSRQVEPGGPKGYFELRFVKEGKEDILSGPRGEVLHELLE